MLEFVFVLDHTAGTLLAVPTLMLAVFALGRSRGGWPVRSRLGPALEASWNRT